MGTSLGAMLSDAGLACDLVSRNTAHVEALNRFGAEIEGAAPVPVRAIHPEGMRGRYDVIILAAKQKDNAEIAEFLLPFLAEDGALVTVQNGLPERGLAEVLGSDRVYGATLGWGAERVGAGKVRVTSRGGYHVALGAYGAGNSLDFLAAMFGGIAQVYKGDLAEIRFAKLSTNASLSTLSAISGLTFYELAKRHRELSLALLRETFAVARAWGCKKLPLNGHDLFKVFGSFARFTLPVALKNYRDTRSGMLLDIRAGRRCEVDLVAGACVSAGAEKGVGTPMLARAVSLVHEIENGLAEIAPESLELLTV